MAAVTGTNGKTTTAFLLRAILEAAGRQTGLLTNIERRVGGEAAPDRASTRPRRSTSSACSARWPTAATEACVLEATSQAGAQGRLEGTRFAVLVFTNLTQDHLDFHGTMEAYFEAKAALFAQAERAVVNVGDEWGRRLAASAPRRGHLRRATRTRSTGSTSSSAAPSTARTRSAPRSPPRRSASTATRSSAGSSRSRACPGRFESIDAGQPFTVIVDYAHTPDSLENVIRTARGLGDGRLTVVFGAGGDRDRGKRPLMGRVVSELADRAILTSDNPRSEAPEAIAAEVADGALGELEIELDRRDAIELALEEARAGRRSS